MPSKPPIRIPPKASPVIKPRFTPSQPARPARPSSRTPPRSQPQSSHQTSRSIPPLPPPTSPPHEPWYGHTPLWSLTKWTANTLVLGCALLWVRDHYIDFSKIGGTSMAPSINPRIHETGRRDWVVVRPYLQRARKRSAGNAGSESSEDDKGVSSGVGDWGEIRRGDVVTFWKPYKPEEVGIKRVVGVEGDEVYPRRGYAVEPDTHDTPRLAGMPDGLPTSDSGNEVGKVVVPYGHVWLEGDNHRCSLDSRDVGPVSKSLILGKAVWIWRGRGQFLRVSDERDKKEKEMGSKVVERKGGMAVPDVFLE